MSVFSLRQSLFEGLNKRFYYGWGVLAVACLGIFGSGPGQSHTFSVFVQPISEDLGVANATLASAYGLATLIAALMLPFMGRLVDRHGSRRMTMVAVTGLGLACMFFGAAANLLWLSVGFAALRFLGQGSLMLNSANMVSQWFSQKRGFAPSIMVMGFGLSMAVHPPLGFWLLSEFGWRTAWMVLGLVTWITMLPPVYLIVADRPEDVDLLPDGRPQAEEGSQQNEATMGLTLAEALRTAVFYLLCFSWSSVSMLVTTLHFYQVSILTARSVDGALAANLFVLSAVVMMVALPLFGRGYDRYRTRYMIALGTGVTGLSLLVITLVNGPMMAIFYAVIFGLNNALSMSLFGYIWARYFGRAHLGSIQGVGQMVAVVGASLGPLPVGIAMDLWGDPTLMIRLLSIYPFLSALLCLFFLRTPKGVAAPSHLE